VHAGLPLVGEIDRARPGEDEIVQALETLGSQPCPRKGDTTARRIQQASARACNRNEDPPVTVDLQSVRPAIILGNLFPTRRRIQSGTHGERDVVT